MTLFYWQPDEKLTSFSFFTFHFYFTTMRLYNIVRQAQPQSGSFTGRLCGKEGLKNFINNILWDTISIVTNFYFNFIISFFVSTETSGLYAAFSFALSAFCFSLVA
jgi:hypothetical protein